MIFEDNFVPQMQLRWEKVKNPNKKDLYAELEKFSSNIEILNEKVVPEEWAPLEKVFGLVLLAAAKGTNRITNGILACQRTQCIFFFQVLDSGPSTASEGAAALATLTCNDSTQTLWQFQDFSFTAPNDFTLTSYSFAAGLTRLSFTTSSRVCHICRLGHADKRLERQSLDEVLKTLISEKNFSISTGRGSCTIWREPPIWRQILYRLARRKPFLRAEIEHLERQNLLLASVQLSRLPIPPDTTEFFNTSHEIISKKGST